MIEVHKLLRTKENELARVRKEIEALRTVAPLLSERDEVADLQLGGDRHVSPVPLETSLAEENTLPDEPSRGSDDVLFDSVPPKRNRLRDWIGRAVGE
jgi:hypothetical protein